MLKIYRIAGTAALAALFIPPAALAGDETPKRPQTSAPVSSSLLSVHESDVTFFQLQVSHWMWLVCSGRCRICAINGAVHLIVFFFITTSCVPNRITYA